MVPTLTTIHEFPVYRLYEWTHGPKKNNNNKNYMNLLLTGFTNVSREKYFTSDDMVRTFSISLSTESLRLIASSTFLGLSFFFIKDLKSVFYGICISKKETMEYERLWTLCYFHLPFADKRITWCLRTGPIIDLGLSETEYVHSAGLDDTVVNVIFIWDPLSCASPMN